MGVPKFFRYISERYPCLSEIVKEYQIPEFDNLYLDMNGIIHMCSHPDDANPHFRITEEKIFADIFHYIEVLFRMIKPQKLFFMAVDGVAPRAKMNQQRGRRFRSAKDAEVMEAKAQERGEQLPTEARFDSNCITPGTVFMDRLQQQLKYFVANKISKDHLWQNCKIILSGHETPGEGEHKIMDYIRYMKSQSDYNPNTRHCLYGLDADLIMLGLCTHEPHFSLLREEVRFGKKAKRKSIPEEITFYLLHLSLMRQYLELEFLPLKNSLPFEYDMEKIIDDWVLMGFLVGNDFIPNLPNLHIVNGALPILYNAYMKILPTLDGYINEAGSLNLERFEKFMAALAAVDMDNFSEQYADLKYFQSKTGRRPNNKERTSYRTKNLVEWEPDESPMEKKPMNPELEALIKSTDDFLLESKKSGWDDDITGVTEIFSDDQTILPVNSRSASVESDVKEVAKSLIGELLEKAMKEVTEEDLPNLQINDTKEKKNETNKAKKDIVMVEPSQSNLDDLALDLIDLREDEDHESPFYSDVESDDDSDELMEAEFLQHKNDYYMNKLDYLKITPKIMRSQAEGYVRAIQWNLNYYYNGCCSWSWYYPHHYAPYISDIKNFSNLKLEYEMGKPFQPFEQLLAVLPAASKELLPPVYQDLMVSQHSPIIDYYPQDFRTDLNGKKQEWEAVVLIPFIAENLLLESMAPCNVKLTLDEQRRNQHGPMLVYEYTSEDLGELESPQYFPVVTHNHAKCTRVTMEEIRVPREKLVKGPCPGGITDVYYPGFPTFKHLKYTGTLEKAKVKVFDQPSQNDNMIISIQAEEKKLDLKELYIELHGKTVFVQWPYLTEAKVVQVSNSTSYIRVDGTLPGELNTDKNFTWLWQSMKSACVTHYKERLGIDVGPITFLVHVKETCGSKYVYSADGNLNIEKQWNNTETIYPLQAIIKKLNVSVNHEVQFSTIQNLFPVASKVFMLGHPHYGTMGEVIDNTTLKSGRIKVSMYVLPEPDFTSLYKYQQEQKYLPASVAAHKLAINSHLLSRITGSIFIVAAHQVNEKSGHRINIGLNLKLNKKNAEMPGYTKKVDGQWLYSPKAVQLVKDYMSEFPQLFKFIQSKLGNDVFTDDDLFPNDDSKARIKEIQDWIKKQPFSEIEHQSVGSQVAEADVVRKIEEIVDQFLATNSKPKEVLMQVKPYLLYKPEVQTGFLPPDPTTTYQLYDRVVNVRASYTVPYGCKGTIIGIQATRNDPRPGTSTDMELMYDVLFDQPFAGGLQLNCSEGRGYRVPRPALINITHGMRIVLQKILNPATNAPWYAGPQVPNVPHGNLPPMHGGHQSAFVNWTPAQQHPFQQGLRQQGFPPQQQPHGSQSFYPQHQGKQQRPQAQAGAGAEFQAFYQDLQRAKPKPPNMYNNSPNNQRGANNFFPAYNQAQNSSTQSNTPKIVSTDETEMLKKLLKINEKNQEAGSSEVSKEHSAPTPSTSTHLTSNNGAQNSHLSTKGKNNVTNTQPLSVQDLFAHARNQDHSPKPSSSTYYSVQLLNYCQANGKGIPRYNYLSCQGGKFRAQIVLSDGRVVIGDERDTKAESSEAAAKKIMTDIVQGVKPNESGTPPNWEMTKVMSNFVNPSGFPNPPKSWCQKDGPKQHSPKKASANQHKNPKNNIPAKSMEKRSDNTSGSTFVPLQAVRQQRNKSNSSSSHDSNSQGGKQPQSPNKAAHKPNNSPAKNKGNPDKQKQNTGESSGKPRQRRSRIAANFSGLNKQ